MDLLAAIRPDEWNFPLLLHVAAAMILVGVLVLAAASLAGAWNSGSAALTRLGFRSLLWAGLPSFIVLRGTSEWIADKEGIDADDPPTWIDMGYMVSDPGLLLLIAALVLTGIGTRRARRGTGSAVKLDRVATVLLGIAIVAYLVAVWAMTTKPA
ncbi:MAG: hypothetical protein WD844_01430 [Thermoleophilaceae bacterium]